MREMIGSAPDSTADDTASAAEPATVPAMSIDESPVEHATEVALVEPVQVDTAGLADLFDDAVQPRSGPQQFLELVDQLTLF